MGWSNPFAAYSLSPPHLIQLSARILYAADDRLLIEPTPMSDADEMSTLGEAIWGRAE